MEPMKPSNQTATAKPCIRLIAGALSGTLLACGLATAPAALAQATGHVKSVTTTLNSSGARKECIGLTLQQRLRYFYRADAAINFSIQYVDGKETLYPVKNDKSAIGSGSFQPKMSQDHCLVWTNLSTRPVTLTFEFARLSPN